MPFLDASSMSGLGTGAFGLPAWAVGALAALFAVLCLWAFRRPAPAGMTGILLRSSVVLIGALFVMSIFDRAATQDRVAARRSLEARNAELTARALMPGSPLACLDAGAGEAVESACEKTLFGKPESAAAAVAYVAARLSLLADGVNYARRADRSFENALTGLRRAIELDRYGIAAHVLETREGCMPQDCPTFALLRDTSILKANLKTRAFDAHVARYASAWPAAPAPLKEPVRDKTPPVAAAPAPASTQVVVAPPAPMPILPVPVAAAPVAVPALVPAPAPVAAAPAPPKRPPAARAVSSVRVDFPSSSSIPPISIMSPEPGEPVPAPKKLPVVPRRPQNQATAPAAR